MASAIEWTDQTWNPVTGCDRVSPGCLPGAHCYALTLAARLKAMGNPRYQVDGDPKSSGPGFGVTLHPDKLTEPLRWRSPRMVFVNSMSDLFHEEIPDEYIAFVFGTMALAPQHTFQVLTKRPERMRDLMLKWKDWKQGAYAETSTMPLPNVWLGVSIENRRFVHRADLLRETPAAVRFISVEPLLGPLVGNVLTDAECERAEAALPIDSPQTMPQGSESQAEWWERLKRDLAPNLDLTGIDWLVVGAESGHRARRMDRAWVRDLREAAGATGTAFFFKQDAVNGRKVGLPELDGRQWAEFPATTRSTS